MKTRSNLEKMSGNKLWWSKLIMRLEIESERFRFCSRLIKTIAELRQNLALSLHPALGGLLQF